MIENIKPMDIEKRSFEIITEILGDRKFPEEQESIIKRVIHTSADFDYTDNLKFSPDAVEKALEALRGGCDIVTDTNMAKAGINKNILASLGGEVHCFMADPDVAAEAKERGVTRAIVSIISMSARMFPFADAYSSSVNTYPAITQYDVFGNMEAFRSVCSRIFSIEYWFVNCQISRPSPRWSTWAPFSSGKDAAKPPQVSHGVPGLSGLYPVPPQSGQRSMH